MNYLELNICSVIISGLSGLGITTLIFVLFIFILSIYILVYLYTFNQRLSKFERWKFLADTLIRNAIFFEEDDTPSSGHSLLKVLEVNLFPVPSRVKKLLADQHFRHLIIRELIAARQSITGTAADNLKNLFKQLELDKDAVQMIKGNSWYLQASGIQYLGVMEMTEHQNLIATFTNDKRGLIRVEAQNTIVKFSGFDGLRFLDTATFPITEWQQIKLLEELSQLPGERFTGIEKWLLSANDTVVIFALKLARNYFRFELYDEVISSLKHTNPEVRQQAILTAKELQTATTATELIQYYESETDRNKLTIIYVLQDVSTEEQLPFLLNIFETGNNQVRIAASKAIAAVGSAGISALDSHQYAGVQPYSDIIKQIKSERQ